MVKIVTIQYYIVKISKSTSPYVKEYFLSRRTHMVMLPCNRQNEKQDKKIIPINTIKDIGMIINLINWDHASSLTIFVIKPHRPWLAILMQTFIIEYGCLPIVVDISQCSCEKRFPFTYIIDDTYSSIHRYL